MSPDILPVGTAKQWSYRERDCKIQKNDLGHWCGYTRTTLDGFTDDDLYDVASGNRLITVHGGITYGPDADGWLGFDCGHANDLCLDETGVPWGEVYERTGRVPGVLGDAETVAEVETVEEVTVWRMADVKAEVESLADQITLLEGFVMACQS